MKYGRKARQVHIVNQINIRIEGSRSFQFSQFLAGNPITNKANCHRWAPKFASYDLLGGQPHLWLVGLLLLFLGMELANSNPGSRHQQLNQARGKVAAHFESVVNANCRLVAPPTRRTAIGRYPKVASYDMLGEQLHYSHPVKHGYEASLAQSIVQCRNSLHTKPLIFVSSQTDTRTDLFTTLNLRFSCAIY